MAANQIDVFLAAIRAIESGNGDPRGDYNARNTSSGAYGAYQIMPQYWAGWAKEAGIAGARITDPKAQDHVARFKLLQYYHRYGSWEAAAIGWFAGPSRAEAYSKGETWMLDLGDGNTRVADYVEKMRGFMGEFGGEEFTSEGLSSTDPVDPYTPDLAERSIFRIPETEQEMDMAASLLVNDNPAAFLSTLMQSISDRVAGGDRIDYRTLGAGSIIEDRVTQLGEEDPEPLGEPSSPSSPSSPSPTHEVV